MIRLLRNSMISRTSRDIYLVFFVPPTSFGEFTRYNSLILAESVNIVDSRFLMGSRRTRLHLVENVRTRNTLSKSSKNATKLENVLSPAKLSLQKASTR